MNFTNDIIKMSYAASAFGMGELYVIPLKIAVETHSKLEKNIPESYYRDLFYKNFKSCDITSLHRANKITLGKSVF